jgi:hypothetical protein
MAVDDRPVQVGQKCALGPSLPKGMLQASSWPQAHSCSHAHAGVQLEPREQWVNTNTP